MRYYKRKYIYSFLDIRLIKSDTKGSTLYFVYAANFVIKSKTFRRSKGLRMLLRGFNSIAEQTLPEYYQINTIAKRSILSYVFYYKKTSIPRANAKLRMIEYSVFKGSAKHEVALYQDIPERTARQRFNRYFNSVFKRIKRIVGNAHVL